MGAWGGGQGPRRAPPVPDENVIKDPAKLEEQKAKGAMRMNDFNPVRRKS